MYNWAEVYIPTSSSTEEWIQVDVCDNIDLNQTDSGYNLTLTTDFTSGYRDEGKWATMTATLTHPNSSVANRPINFQDEYVNEHLGTILTDINGNATISVEINNNQTIGPHIISASFSLYAYNFTKYTIFEYDTANDINLTLNSLSKSVVDLGGTDPTVIVDGFLEDPLNGNQVNHGLVNFTLIDKGTQIPLPGVLNPSSTDTGDTGTFNEELSIDYSVPSGEYQIQADFYGIWYYDFYGTPLYDFEPLINDTLVRLDLNITKPNDYSVWFYIDDFAANDIYNPEVERSSTIELKAIIKDEGIPLENVSVGFYNSFDVLGSDTTDPSGTAIYYYTIDDSVPAGPNRIYARFSDIVNNSYFILNAPIHFDSLNNFPDPPKISRVVHPSEDYIFSISGKLYDEFSNPIKYGDFNINLYDGGAPVTFYLNEETGPTRTDEFGDFFIEYSVADITPLTNYTVTLNFSGSFTYPTTPEPSFNFPAYSNFTASVTSTHDLEVWDPYDIDIFFYIDGKPALSVYDDANLPERYNQGDNITLEFLILRSSIGVTDNTARIYDVDQDNQIVGTYTYDNTEIPQGYGSITINTTGWSAGIHQLRINWNILPTYNSTYIIINKTATINVDPLTPAAQSITRGIEGFTITGSVYDSSEDLRGLEVSIHLLDSLNQDRSAFLNVDQQYKIIDQLDGSFEFNVFNIDQTLIQGTYKIRIDFNGTIYNFYLGSGIDVSDYMVHFTSNIIYINITAGTQIVQQDYYTLIWETEFPTKWFEGDTLIVTGNLTWDNNTEISNMRIRVVVEDLYGGQITLNDTVFTDQYGFFNVSIYIDPSDPWPNDRSDSRIFVIFDPIINGVDYVEPTNEQYL